MFLWGAVLYLDTSNPPDGAHTIYVLGRQWMWKVQHPLGAREINELHVPVGRPIKLFITSEDVIHSFFLPSFRIKMDALPGRYTTTWFQANRTGRFHIFCAEYCGSYHAGMIGRVVVMEPAEYADWLSQNNTGRIPLAAGGEELFRRLDCTSCHQAGPLPGGRVRAPNLQGLLGRRVVLTNGRTVTADENYLRESVLNPQAMVVAGYAPIMPSYRGKISEEELVQLIAYIKTLGTQERAP
jgi:cytochrome c oxidase subunit 2